MKESYGERVDGKFWRGESDCPVKECSGEDGVLTLRIQTIHHAADQLQLVLQAKVDEVGINQHAVRRYESGVVLEE